MVNNRLDSRRIAIFLAFAFGIAWLSALAVYLTGGLANSPVLIPGANITLASVLVAVVYMGAPALAHVLTRLITREGWSNTWLRPRRRSWPYWVAAWLTPAIMTIVGGALYFALFPQYFDPSMGMLRDMAAEAGQALPLSPQMIVVIQAVSGVLMAPLLNGLFAFGEEFGWRAYLQPKLLPLGGRKAILLIGLIWGVWHWPIIAMGHNYGLEYPGAPWLGMLVMVWLTIGLATFFGWLTIRAGNVWPAVIGHAAVNGISGLAALFLAGKPNLLLGPYPSGIVGSVGWVALTLVLLLVPGALRSRQEEPPPADGATPTA